MPRLLWQRELSTRMKMFEISLAVAHPPSMSSSNSQIMMNVLTDYCRRQDGVTADDLNIEHASSQSGGRRGSETKASVIRFSCCAQTILENFFCASNHALAIYRYVYIYRYIYRYIYLDETLA